MVSIASFIRLLLIGLPLGVMLVVSDVRGEAK